MSIADQVQSLARREYALLRTCAQAVDRRLEPAVSSSPALSTAFSRVRDALREFDDLVAGATQTKTTPTHADRPSPAPAAGDTAPEPAANTEPEVREEPAADKPAAEEPLTREPVVEQHAPEPTETEVEHLAEEFLEEETDHLSGELADNEDLREVQARLRAKHTLEEQGEQHH